MRSPLAVANVYVWRTLALALGCALGACGGGAHHVVIRVTPAVALYDEPRSIVASGLQPGEVVTISTRSVQPGVIFAASANYQANASGVVDLARTAPRSGSYSGVDSMGLFWSAHFVSSHAPPVHSAITTLTVSAGSHRLASATVVQLFRSPGVIEQRVDLKSAGFVGEYFAPPGSGRRPAVVTWGGSEGGIDVSALEAAMLASRGIPALAVAYFDEPGLPCSLSDIPLEYFVRAIRWTSRQPQVDPARVWLLSASRGSESDLLVASHWPGLVHGLVAVAPSAFSYGSFPGTCRPSGRAAWTLHGKPLAQGFAAGGNSYINTPSGLAFDALPGFRFGLRSPDTQAARIPVWKIRGPVLLVSGGDDQTWPSNLYADQIMAGLHSNPAVHEHLNYPAAGHIVLWFPYWPTPIVDQSSFGPIALGGTSAGDNAAHVRDWPAMIAFITAH